MAVVKTVTSIFGSFLAGLNTMGYFSAANNLGQAITSLCSLVRPPHSLSPFVSIKASSHISPVIYVYSLT